VNDRIENGPGHSRIGEHRISECRLEDALGELVCHLRDVVH